MGDKLPRNVTLQAWFTRQFFWHGTHLNLAPVPKATFTPQEKNGRARMTISKGNMHSSKATIVYTLQIGMARPIIILTLLFCPVV